VAFFAVAFFAVAFFAVAFFAVAFFAVAFFAGTIYLLLTASALPGHYTWQGLLGARVPRHAALKAPPTASTARSVPSSHTGWRDDTRSSRPMLEESIRSVTTGVQRTARAESCDAPKATPGNP
jgi:hypothetical protein